MSFCSFKNSEKYKDHFEPGVYVCSKCEYELFSSKSKYEHSSPWPAFSKVINSDSLRRVEESPSALKISCGKCGNGLGHEFLGDGPKKGTSRF